MEIASKIDKKQSRKNDLMNWLFSLLSFKLYFCFCWIICAIPFKHKRCQTSIKQQNEILQYFMEKL